MKRSGRTLAAGAVFTATLAFAAVALAADGDPDTTFGGDGSVTTPVSSGDVGDFIANVAIQPDGKIVVAGSADPPAATGVDFALARYNPDGTLDDTNDADPGVTFGGDGVVTVNASSGAGNVDLADGLVIQPDGKIVAAGNAKVGSPAQDDFALVRVNSDGSLDNSADSDPGVAFGGDGIVTTPVGGSQFDAAFSLALQNDGKLVAAGEVDVDPGVDSASDFAVVRYNPDGSLDDGGDGLAGAGFGGDGIATTDFAGEDDLATAVAIQSDGNVVAAGGANTVTDREFGISRYNGVDGSPDTSFNTIGKTQTDFTGGTDTPQDIAIQSDGKLVVSGRATVSGAEQFGLARYLPSNGGLDAAFDGDPAMPGFPGDGKVTTAFGSGSNARGVAIAPDGRIVAAGSGDSDPGAGFEFDLVAARYDPAAGTLDPSFAGDGKATLGIAPATLQDAANDVAVQPDGRIIGAGSANLAGATGTDFAVARLEGSLLPPPPPPPVTPVTPVTPVVTPQAVENPECAKLRKKLKKAKTKKKKKKIRKKLRALSC